MEAFPCDNGSPAAFFYVDAPAGALIRIDSSTDSFGVLGFADCANGPEGCGGTPYTANMRNIRLFAVELGGPDAGCGDFTITATSQ